MSRTKPKPKPKPRPSILDVVAQVKTPTRGVEIPAAALVEIREVFAAVKSGALPSIGCERLAKIIKERHELTLAVTTLAKKLQEIKRS